MKGLSQTHLVGENAIDSILVEGDHPVETADLVVAHRATLDVKGRLVESGEVRGRKRTKNAVQLGHFSFR